MNIEMKAIKKQHYLIAIVICVACIIGLCIYYFVGSFSQSDKTEYVYIYDTDDLDDVSKKLSAFSTERAITAFRLMARHSGYADHIRSGRYEVRPDESTITVFRHLKNGHQSPVMLTIPESRTTDRLAGALSKKLMLDSASVAILLKDSAFCAKLGLEHVAGQPDGPHAERARPLLGCRPYGKG